MSSDDASAPPDLVRVQSCLRELCHAHVDAVPWASLRAASVCAALFAATCETSSTTPSPLRHAQAFPCAAFALAFHPAADVLAVGLVSGSLQLFRYGPGSAAPALSLALHAGAVRALDFAPAGDGA